MAGTVSVDAPAYEKATQIKGHLTNSVAPSLTTLKTLTGQLAGNTNFQGKHADEYRKAHQDLVNTATKFQQAAEELHQAVTKVIQNVASAGGNVF